MAADRAGCRWTGQPSTKSRAGHPSVRVFSALLRCRAGLRRLTLCVPHHRQHDGCQRWLITPKSGAFPAARPAKIFTCSTSWPRSGASDSSGVETDCEPIEIMPRVCPTGCLLAPVRLPAESWRSKTRPGSFCFITRPYSACFAAGLIAWRSFWQSRSGEISEILSQRSGSNLAHGLSNHSPEDLQALIDGLEDSGAAEALQHAFRQSTDAVQFKQANAHLVRRISHAQAGPLFA